MQTCETFELGIEKRSRGALTQEELSALEAHLMTCMSCQAYAGLVNRTVTVMNAATLNPEFTLETLLKRFSTEKRRAFAPLVVSTAVGLGAVVLAPIPMVFAFAVGGMGLLLTLGFRLRIALRERTARNLADHQGEFLLLYRGEIERRIRILRMMVGVIPVMAGVTLTAYLQGQWPASLRNPAILCLWLLPMVAAEVLILIRNVRDVPRLKRELAALHRD